MKKILVIQTAFLGDVVLATPVLEALNNARQYAAIDMLVRKGNESLLKDHPFIHKLFVWDKKNGKYKEMWRILKKIRAEYYDEVVNLQRFSSSGLLTTFSRGSVTAGFNKNPWSTFFTHSLPHKLDGQHEIHRNLSLLKPLGIQPLAKPKLYPSKHDHEQVKAYKSQSYVCMAPTSVWYTKQWYWEKWVALINEMPQLQIYLLGAPGDRAQCDQILEAARHDRVTNLCGELSLLQSAALMKDAQMNYVNDSAPMHLCSAVNAPVTAIYCSTVPKFGFGPLSEVSRVVEVEEELGCRPCGLHGKSACPKGHFKCAKDIKIKQVLHDQQ